MNNVDLSLVLTQPPEEVRWLDLFVIANLSILYFSGQHVSELHMYHFFYFSLRLRVFHLQFCWFRISRRSLSHEIIVLLEKSISYFMSIMYNYMFLNFGKIIFINKEQVLIFSTAHL